MENIVQGQWFRGPSADLGEPIDQSLRFSSSGYLTRAQLSTGDGQINDSGRIFTFSTWFKHGDMGETNIFGIHPSGSDNWLLLWTTGQLGFAGRDNGTGFGPYNSTRVYRDPNAWYHLFLTCSAGVLTLYVNGVQGDQTDTQNHSMDRDFVLGAENNIGGSPMDAYLAETYFIQGTVLHPVNDGFIRLNKDGIYVPDTPTISSYGTNGWHLTYDSSQANGIGHDSSGNGNHFTATGFDTTAISSANRLNDIDIKDTPTSNYATFNPLWPQTTPSLKGANMELATANTITGQATFRFPVGTTGKYWVEAGTANLGNTTNSPALCLTSELDAAGLTASAHLSTANYSTVSGWGPAYSNFNSTSSTAYTEVGGRVGMAIDFDNQEVKHYNNSTLLNTDTTVDFTKELALVVMQPSTSYNTYEPYLNAGQQAFIQTVPTGFNELQTNNLPEPTIKDGSDHFQVLYNTGANILGDAQAAFSSGMYMIKGDNSGQVFYYIDPINGTSAAHRTPLPTSTSAYVPNSSGNSYAWCWNCPDTFTATGITAGRRNVDAGFSVVTYTGDNTNPRSIPHGLGRQVGWVILWNPEANDTTCFITGLPGTGTNTENFIWNTAEASSNQFSAGTQHTPTDNDNFIVGNSAGGSGVTGVNQNGINYTAFCWAPVPGYSAMGTYSGLGSTDGPVIYCGFKPKMVIIKSQGADHWHIYDTLRDTANPCDGVFWVDDTGSETNAGGNSDIDILSNGFKLRGTNGAINGGNNYCYVAFAENPFGGENVPPATAR